MLFQRPKQNDCILEQQFVQGERMKFYTFVDCNGSAEYIRIYESIVIEVFLRHKIYKIGAYVTRFYIENPNFIVTSRGKIK